MDRIGYRFRAGSSCPTSPGLRPNHERTSRADGTRKGEVHRLRCPTPRDAHAGAAHAMPASSRICGFPGHLHLFLGRAVLQKAVDARNDVKAWGEKFRQGRSSPFRAWRVCPCISFDQPVAARSPTDRWRDHPFHRLTAMDRRSPKPIVPWSIRVAIIPLWRKMACRLPPAHQRDVVLVAEMAGVSITTAPAFTAKGAKRSDTAARR